MKRHTLFIPILLLLIISCVPQERKYHIKGTLPLDLRTEEKKIYLMDANDRAVDSTTIKKGNFEMRGHLSKKTDLKEIFKLSVPRLYETRLVLGEEKKSIYVDMTKLWASGTPYNDAILAYEETLDSLVNYYFSIFRSYIGISVQDSEVEQEIDSLYFEMKRKRVQESLSVIRQHRNDIVGLHATKTLLANLSQKDAKQFNSLVDSLGDIIKNNAEILEMAKKFNDGVKTNPGNMFKDIEGYDLEGNKVKLSQYVKKGYYVVVDFWGTWCKTCQKELQEINRLRTLYKGEKINFVGILIQEEQENLKTALKRLDVDWPQIIDKNDDALRKYNVSLIPEIMIIDPYGFIIARHLRGNRPAEVLFELYFETSDRKRTEKKYFFEDDIKLILK